MVKYLLKRVIILMLFLAFFASKVNAIYDPLSVPNNKYGIHIIDENDLENAASLVNSSGGDWGYITVVIRENERFVDKWNRIFRRMNKYHLIPIIRTATTPIEDFWTKPDLEDAFKWADFLSKLNWFTKNRYIILFNEPNHAKEWGREVNPEEYAQILTQYSQELKKKSTDFFILPAGLDASAPNSNSTMNEVDFLNAMISSKPDIFYYIDGWTTHSYPNFYSKTINKYSNRRTLRTYLWEINLLKNLGLKKSLPIFITETGWPHREGKQLHPNLLSVDKISDLLKKASEEIWNDIQIVAITPFVLNYQSYPFSNFSWQKKGEEKFFPQFDMYRSIPKVAGRPILNTVYLTQTRKSVLGTSSKNILTSSANKSENKKTDNIEFLLGATKLFLRKVSRFIFSHI